MWKREDEKKRSEKKKSPDTHDVNNDRSSFDVILFIFIFNFFFGKNTKRERKGAKGGSGLRVKRHNTTYIQSDTVYCTVKCDLQNCTGDSFGTAVRKREAHTWTEKNKK